MSPAEPTARAASLPVVGVNVAGYFDSALGVGVAGRQVRDTLRAGGTPVASFPLRGRSARAVGGGPGAGAAGERGPYPLNLVCANAEAAPAVLDELGLGFFEERYTIGLWWWELECFPERWMRAFDQVDEVWVGSRFVAEALAPISPVPVVRVPLPVARPKPAPRDRSALGLPEGMLFLYVFDYASVFERKNPLAAVEAFGRAFRDGAGASLVFKCVGSEAYPAEHARLLDAARRQRGVTVIDEYLPLEEKDALVASCDCYVSLHRSEGFGLTIAEAVLLEKPVIATGYSGPMDFLSPSTAYLVDFELVDVGPGHDPYPPTARWAAPDVEHAARLMRAVAENRDEASARAKRARQGFEREHDPPAASRAMLRRLAAVAKLPASANGRPAVLDTRTLEERIWSAGVASRTPASRRSRLRGLARRALVRVIRPHAVHQRLVDEEILRALRTLDERVQGLGVSQASLQAELRARNDIDQ